MRAELNVVCRNSLKLGVALGLTLALSTQAFALKTGHGRVVSAPGEPLRVSIPLLEVLAADVSTLQVKVASADAWAKAGLTPPVSLASMAVSIEAGFVKDSRTLVLRSNQGVDRQVIDVLLEVSSASGSTQVQSSFLVLTRADEGTAGSVLVKPGDTLSGIALANPVAGADLYQMLWALYQANPQAFISQNMNLLKAGVTLKIPDAQTVRAIDPKLARDMYQKHVNALKDLRGNSNTANATSRAPTVAVPASSTQSTAVSTAGAAPTPSSGDRVLLTSASTAEQKEDARVAAAKEIAEIQSRVDSLQQNVQQLKDALNQGAGAASGTPGSPGTTGSAGTTGSTGTTGATGTTGTTGTTGSAGATGSVSSAPAAGAPGAAGSADATGATAASSANGSAGSASSAGSTTGTTSQSTQHTLAQLWSKLTTSAVGILTLILGFGGLLVAWLLRRASARREQAAVEGDDLPEPLNPNARTALDQKLQAIDLNLDTTSATTKIEPSLVNPSASPKA